MKSENASLQSEGFELISSKQVEVLCSTHQSNFFCRGRIEATLRRTNVLAEVTNSVQCGGLRVEHLLGPKASSRTMDSKTSSIFGSDGDPEFHGPAGVARQGAAGTGGPAGLRHFIYRSSFLDQYVASEFSPPLHIPSAQKRYVSLCR